MALFDSIITEVTTQLISSGQFTDCTIQASGNGNMRPNPLKKPHIMVGLASAEITQCATNRNSSYGSATLRYKGDITLKIDIAVPFELHGITCTNIFSRLCTCLMGGLESTLEPVKISCGEVSSDRYSQAFVQSVRVGFNAILTI
ncbi:MAG: hypothetical protein IJL87_05675 [Clostridia bacterium]|nr:hypothetical protein [Clostridia bacterium]